MISGMRTSEQCSRFELRNLVEKYDSENSSCAYTKPSGIEQEFK